jgi:hypothetical protein
MKKLSINVTGAADESASLEEIVNIAADLGVKLYKDKLKYKSCFNSRHTFYYNSDIENMNEVYYAMHIVEKGPTRIHVKFDQKKSFLVYLDNTPFEQDELSKYLVGTFKVKIQGVNMTEFNGSINARIFFYDAVEAYHVYFESKGSKENHIVIDGKEYPFQPKEPYPKNIEILHYKRYNSVAFSIDELEACLEKTVNTFGSPIFKTLPKP